MTDEKKPETAFDHVAAGYDDRFSNQPIARLLRGKVHWRLNDLLSRNCSVLEIGCGTGEDVKHFASLGHDVMATDPSENMLNIVRQKVRDMQGNGPIKTDIWDADLPMPAEILENGPYDVVFSNFGAINCVSDLSHLKSQIALVARPGGACALVLMNRWCMLEVVLNLLALKPQNILRRFRRHGIANLEDGSTLNIFYPSVAKIKRAFAPDFKIESYTPIGVFFPPSELYCAFQKRPWLFRTARFLDRTLGNIWPFSRTADHFMIVLRHT